MDAISVVAEALDAVAPTIGRFLLARFALALLALNMRNTGFR